jgi:RimJ/RimL family protein N-acetyltransferase
MAGRVITETERLILRELVDDDLEAYHLLNTDPEVIRHLHFPPPASPEQSLALMRSRRASDYEGLGYGRWACVLKDTGEMIGWSGPRLLPEIGEVEMGYRFLPRHWGKGYATEAGAAVVRHCFTVLGMRQLVSLVAPENVASANVVRKLGFRHTGDIVITGNVAGRWLKEA